MGSRDDAPATRLTVLLSWLGRAPRSILSAARGAPLSRCSAQPRSSSGSSGLLTSSSRTASWNSATRRRVAHLKRHAQSCRGRPGRATEDNHLNSDYLTANLPAMLAMIVASADAHAGVGTGLNSVGTLIADMQARPHDPGASELSLKTTKDGLHDPTIRAATHFVRGGLGTV